MAALGARCGRARRCPRRMAARWICLAVLALALSVPASAGAAMLHVSPDGSDAADGTAAAPLHTIGRAAAVAASGDEVLVAPGRYPEQVTVNTRDAGVAFVADTSSGERPAVDGEGTRQFGFYVIGADDVTVSGFEITGQTDAGVYTRGLRDVVSGNVIHHVGSTAVNASNGVRVVWGGDDRVTGNTIHSIGPGGESMGIWLVQTRGALVDANSVYLVRKEGVRDWQGLDNTTPSNRLFLNWAGISFNTSTGSTATNNEIYDNTEGFDVKHASHSTV